MQPRRALANRPTLRVARKPPINPFPLLSLPTDIQCEILKYPLSLKEFLALREKSRAVYTRLNDCVEILDGNDRGSLFPDLVHDMKRIKRISFDYPIYISSEEELINLSQHPTLREASFDISAIVDETDNVETLYRLINVFFENYSRTQKKAICQDCHSSDPAYRFFFFYLSIPSSEVHGIEVSEGSIFLIDPPVNNRTDLTDFYITLSDIVPICEYRGPLNEAGETIDSLPCLQRVYYKFDSRYIDEMQFIPLARGMRDRIFSVPHITEYYASYPKIYGFLFAKPHTSGMIEAITSGARLDNQTFLHVTQLWAIPFNRIDWVREVFPNLIDIRISLASIHNRNGISYANYGVSFDEFVTMLDKYGKIIITNDLVHPFTIADYLKLFPDNLRNRITFEESE